MANIILTSNARFSPFSYQELLHPALMATQAHLEIENAYGDLNTQANTIASLADETLDARTYALYKAYELDLRALADLLASKGLDVSSRQALLDMRSRFASEITPIKNAIERRRLLADELRKALLLNPTLMFQRDFNLRNRDTSLDRFLENPDYNYGDQYSGALLTKEVSNMARHLAKELRGTSTGKLDDYTNIFIKKYGLSSSEVMRAIENPRDPRGARALAAIYQSAVDKVPESLRNLYAKDIEKYATQGFWDAIGLDLISTYDNYEERLKALKKGKEEKPVTIPWSSTEIPIGKAVNKESKLMKDLSSLINIEGNNKRIKKIKVAYSDYEGYGPLRYDSSADVDLFDSSNNNRLKTKAEFIALAKGNKNLEKALSAFYEGKVTPIIDKYNEGKVEGVTFNNIADLYDYEADLVAKEGTSTFIKGLDFNVGTSHEDIGKAFSKVIGERVYEVKESTDGKTFSKGESMKLNDLLKKAKERGDAINTYISMNKGDEGFVFRMGNQVYKLPINTKNDAGLSLLNLMQLHEDLSNRGEKDASDNLIESILATSSFYTGYKYNPTESKIIQSTGIK